MKAGQTDFNIGDKVKIKLLKSDEDYDDLNGRTGEVTHPFAFGETKTGWVGIYLDEKSSYGDKININSKQISLFNNIKPFVKKAIENWVNKEYGDDNTHIAYNEELTKKESIHCSKIKTFSGDAYAFSSSPSKIGDKPTLWLRLENENISVNTDNLPFYYEFMSDEDMYENISAIMDVLNTRQRDIEIALNARLIEPIREIIHFNGNPIGHSVFGIKDTLKPIDEYIAEIKASEQYQAYASGLEKSASLEQSAAEHKAACGLSQEEIQATIYDTKDVDVGLSHK